MDIELSVDRSDEAHPKLSIIALKTSYASPVSDSPSHLDFQVSIFQLRFSAREYALAPST